MKKAVMMLVLLLSLTFSIAQETDDIYDEEPVVKECNLGCKVWQFFFGSKEARADWFCHLSVGE